MSQIKIAVVGVTGRMGSSIIKAALEDESISITSATARPNSDLVGEDIGLVAGLKTQGVEVQQALDKDFDVLIDFTSPSFTLGNIKYCVTHKKAIVIGTTGFNDDELKTIDSASRSIPIVIASNTSVGVNVLLELVAMATKALNGVADIEIVEAHHKHKVDAPSGTALTIGKTIASTLDKNLDEIATYTRYGNVGPRPQGSVGFSVVRGGDVVGEHNIVYYMDGERVEISHKATDRMIFARGALKAGSWLSAQPAGLYTMKDVLGIDNS